MYWSVGIAVLLVVLSLEGLLTQQLSNEEENAKIEAKNNCKCVRHFQCKNDTNSIDVFGENIFAPRIRRIECKGGEITNELVCCKLDNVVTTQKPTDRDQTNVIPVGPTKTPCGSVKTSVIPRIHNKDDDLTAVDGEFPWIVAIFNSTQFHCGGTLIHPKVVLTANHCVYRKNPNDFTVRANGKVDLPGEGQSKKYVSEIIGHPRYAHTGRLYHDAALLILDTPLVDENINTLCLPPQNFDLEGRKCIVAGWGQDRSGKNRQKLKRVELPFVSRNQCETLMKNSRLGRNFDLHSSFMCAGGEEDRDACIGDGGGPLVCEMPSDPNQFFQAGIVSWGIGCGLKDVPGVYTDVKRISGWIEDELERRSLCVLQYCLFDMIGLVIWTVLLAAMPIGSTSVGSLKRIDKRSVSDDNALIEILHNCKCVRHYLCGGGKIITDGRNVIQGRFLNFPIFCKSDDGIKGQFICCKLEAIKNESVSNKINFGNNDEKFPWMAAIFSKTADGKFEFKCGGSLINKKVVLTASHSVNDLSSEDLVVVVSGKEKRSLQVSTDKEKSYVSKIIRHPRYNKETLINDAALLILKKEFKVGDESTIKTLNLPSPEQTTDLEPYHCVVAGWGEIANKATSDTLKKLKLPFVNHARCQDLLRKTALGPYFILNDSFLCAGGENGTDACTGDGGGPLMCKAVGTKGYFQAGIVSWGMGCFNENVPGVYTNVHKISEWIENEIDNNT
ncbi:uncharacterized protein LOC108912856 [Anoplophora glabripennis]|uniref:uncharacterized protein LOC108912856 n=1 Tax=Anoplophora glabripennis TaxID=217634 RepID=UPI000C77F302|nr:uncharacterized protein LOC108912856 [Anoplophora glabripennis]